MEEATVEDPWRELDLLNRKVTQCAPDGTAFKLEEPIQDSVELQDVDWNEVRLITISMTCKDKDGNPVPWMKCCWAGGQEGVMTIKRNWKMLMEGMKSAFQMLKLGEVAWFRLPKSGQKCEFLLRYPVLEEDIFVRIMLKAVQAKVLKEPKKQDPYSELEKILKIKEGVDKEYLKHRNIEYGLDQYNKLWNKYTGLISHAKKDDEYGSIVQEASQEIVKIRNNIGLILLRAKRYEESLKHLDFVLSKDSSNMKAIHRKAYCLEAVCAWDESLLWFKRVKDISSITRLQGKITSRNTTIMSHLQRRGLN